jgi:hypothetical protein
MPKSQKDSLQLERMFFFTSLPVRSLTLHSTSYEIGVNGDDSNLRLATTVPGLKKPLARASSNSYNPSSSRGRKKTKKLQSLI